VKLDDYLLALTAGLLARGEAEFPAALASAEKSVDMTTPRAPKRRSLGARLADGREVGLAAWLREARAGAPRAVRVAEGARAERPGLPAHMAAGFAGSASCVLAVAEGPRRGAYAFATLLCPRAAMTPDAFVRWVDRQSERAALWPRLAKDIDEFQRMNGRPGATAETVRGLLLSGEGTTILDFIGDNLVKRVQSKQKRAGAPLAFGDGERELFASADPDRIERALAQMSGAGAFVPSEQQLRANGEVSAAEFAGLVDAQDARAAIWAALQNELAGVLGKDAKDVGEPAAALRALPADDFRMYATLLLGAAQRSAAGAGAPLRVPESLRGRVGTDYDALDAEARAGYVPGPERLQLAPNPAPWEYYALVEIPGAPAAETEALAPARDAWRAALTAAETFAKRVESPFSEAFRLAAFALERPNADAAAVAAAGFAENARAVWTRESGTVAELGLPAASAAALLSAAIGDVFGGMGSWNDETPRDAADAAEYERVSAALFARLRALYSAALSLP
jgi:hypothetical protein